MRALTSICVSVVVSAVMPFAAQACSPSYVVRAGDSLSGIAASQYRDAFRWTEIYEANKTSIGPDPDRILVGDVLQLSCPVQEIAEAENGADTEAFAKEAVAPMLVLRTVVGMPPFSDSTLAKGGMFVDLFEQISVADGRPRDLRLQRGSYGLPDLSPGDDVWVFPVHEPVCIGGNGGTECADWALSEPLVEVVVGLYSRVGEAPLSNRSADVQGRRICVAQGQSTGVLDENGRNWVADGAVIVMPAPTHRACFAMLLDNRVDGVLTNDLTARAIAVEPRYRGNFELQGLPLGVEMLYAAVLRTGEGAEVINQTLLQMRRDGRFAALMARYLPERQTGF